MNFSTFPTALVLLGGFLLTGATATDKPCPVCEMSDAVEKSLDFGKKTDCFDSIANHIKLELFASLTYLRLGAHFLQSNYFRPGIAHMLLKHAGEERQHAKALMDYLTMRGQEIQDEVLGEINPGDVVDQLAAKVNSLNGNGKPKSLMLGGLMMAFDLEKKVRDEFRKIIRTCEDVEDEAHKHEGSDYHASDVLTGEFLDEQHKGVRELAGHVSTLDRLINGHGNSVTLAELEFDRSLME